MHASLILRQAQDDRILFAVRLADLSFPNSIWGRYLFPRNSISRISEAMELRGQLRSQMEFGNEGEIAGHPELVEGSDSCGFSSESTGLV
jgi:hypothetical protein